MPQIKDSILHDVKQLIGQEWDDPTFDLDLTIHVNGLWLELEQLGVGPAAGFAIEDENTKWEDFIPKSNLLNAVKQFVFHKTRLAFDPPQTGPLVKAIEDQLTRLEFRINVEAERPAIVVVPVVEDVIIFPDSQTGA